MMESSPTPELGNKIPYHRMSTLHWLKYKSTLYFFRFAPTDSDSGNSGKTTDRLTQSNIAPDFFLKGTILSHCVIKISVIAGNE